MNQIEIPGFNNPPANREGYFNPVPRNNSPSMTYDNPVVHEVLPAPLLDKPKRPLSGYNFFFQDERMRLLEVLPERPADRKPRRSHGKLGFKEMATIIGLRWRALDPATKSRYDKMAQRDTLRYRRERAAFLRQQDALERKKEEDTFLAEDLEPIQWDEMKVALRSHASFDNGISHLASQLDKESIDMIVQIFR